LAERGIANKDQGTFGALVVVCDFPFCMWVLAEVLFWMKIEFVLRSGINLLEFVLVERETTANQAL